MNPRFVKRELIAPDRLVFDHNALKLALHAKLINCLNYRIFTRGRNSLKEWSVQINPKQGSFFEAALFSLFLLILLTLLALVAFLFLALAILCHNCLL